MTARPTFTITEVLYGGICAAVFSGIVLAILSMLAGHPFWMPFNVTTQAIHGPEVRHIDAVDLPHTGLGLAIHLISCLFWAGIATVLLRLSHSTALAAVGTALLALLIDYGLLPVRLSPGWHLVLPFPSVIGGFAALGLGLWLGLWLAKSTRPLRSQKLNVPAPLQRSESVNTKSGPSELRHPGKLVIDQRQQRIDPTNQVTRDPNSRPDLNRKQPGGKS